MLVLNPWAASPAPKIIFLRNSVLLCGSFSGNSCWDGRAQLDLQDPRSCSLGWVFSVAQKMLSGEQHLGSFFNVASWFFCCCFCCLTKYQTESTSKWGNDFGLVSGYSPSFWLFTRVPSPYGDGVSHTQGGSSHLRQTSLEAPIGVSPGDSHLECSFFLIQCDSAAKRLWSESACHWCWKQQ